MLQTWLRHSARSLIGLALPLAMLAVAWRLVDLPAGLQRLAGTGPLALLAFLPLVAILAFDAHGWRLLLASGGQRRVALGQVLAARLAGEAVGALPSAGLAGEGASAWYLWRRARVPLGASIGSLAARRVLLAAGQAGILVVAALVASAEPEVPRWLVASLAAAALALLAAAAIGSHVLVHGALFSRAHRVLRRLAWPGPRPWAGGAGLRMADREAASPFLGSWRPRFAAALSFALMLVAELVETLVLLRLVGAEVSVAQALAIEPLVSLLRALVIVAPAGLGVQELGYVTLLRLVGVPEAAGVGAAFVLLKRTRELASATLGWAVLLAVDAERGPAMEVSSEPGEAVEGAVHLRVPQPDDANAPDRARVA